MLLSLPYLSRRRGKWYERLCINLEHMKKRSLSLQVAELALKDVCFYYEFLNFYFFQTIKFK